MRRRALVGMMMVVGLLLFPIPDGEAQPPPATHDVGAVYAQILSGEGDVALSGPPPSLEAISGAMATNLGNIVCGASGAHEFVADDDVVAVTIADDPANGAGAGADMVTYEFSDGSTAHHSFRNCEFVRVWSGIGDEVVHVNGLDANTDVNVIVVVTAGKVPDEIEVVPEDGKDQVLIAADALADPPNDGMPFADFAVRILTSGGNDLVQAEAAYNGNLLAVTGEGNDTVRSAGGADRIFLEDGDDRAFTAKNADFVSGGTGDDTIHGNRGEDELFGDEGDDRLFGYSQNDLLVGGPGNDKLHGNTGDDELFGEDGDDSLFGYADSDVLSGGPGNDLASGNFGDDQVFGDGGNDTLFGADGVDEVVGGPGNDNVNGNSGNDSLFGGAGNDEMDGGINNDTCNGNSGTDTATRCETVVSVP